MRWQSRLLLNNLSVVVAAVLVVVTAYLYWLVFTAPDHRTLTVSYLNVGQGDATLIETPNGRQLLIDGGAGDQVLRALGRELPWFDRSLDVVIATHPDQDHIGGLIEVARRYEVGVFFHSGVESEGEVDDQLLAELRQNGTDIRTLRAGYVLALSPAVHFDVLFPPVDPAGMEPNDASVVGRLVYGETAWLFSGDAPSAVEDYVASQYSDNLASEVIQVGHHGSDTSSAPAWLGWSEAVYAVVSAGADNNYGHPHQQVLERLERFGMEILETSEGGAIRFESDGRDVRLLAR